MWKERVFNLFEYLYKGIVSKRSHACVGVSVKVSCVYIKSSFDKWVECIGVVMNWVQPVEKFLVLVLEGILSLGLGLGLPYERG